MLNRDATSILSEIRESPFADLAQSILKTLNEGKSELVKERKQPKTAQSAEMSQAVVFDSIETSGLKSEQREKLDIRVRPFNEEESTKIILRAVRRKFVEPANLLDPINKMMTKYGIESAEFIDVNDDRNNVTLEEFKSLFNDDAVVKLRNVINEELGELN